MRRNELGASALVSSSAGCPPSDVRWSLPSRTFASDFVVSINRVIFFGVLVKMAKIPFFCFFANGNVFIQMMFSVLSGWLVFEHEKSVYRKQWQDDELLQRNCFFQLSVPRNDGGVQFWAALE